MPGMSIELTPLPKAELANAIFNDFHRCNLVQSLGCMKLSVAPGSIRMLIGTFSILPCMINSPSSLAFSMLLSSTCFILSGRPFISCAGGALYVHLTEFDGVLVDDTPSGTISLSFPGSGVGNQILNPMMRNHLRLGNLVR